jgi:hypothetical protein
MTISPVICPKLSLTTSSCPYFSVTVTESCLCVASSTAWYIFASNSTTWSLINKMSPLEPTDDILERGKNRRKGIHFFLLRSILKTSKAQSERSGSSISGMPQPQNVHPLLFSSGGPATLSSDTSLRCKLKSPSWRLVTDTSAKLSSAMTVWAWDFLESETITCLFVRRRIRAEV